MMINPLQFYEIKNIKKICMLTTEYLKIVDNVNIYVLNYPFSEDILCLE